jgi:hypothetical protein
MTGFVRNIVALENIALSESDVKPSGRVCQDRLPCKLAARIAAGADDHLHDSRTDSGAGIFLC